MCRKVQEDTELEDARRGLCPGTVSVWMVGFTGEPGQAEAARSGWARWYRPDILAAELGLPSEVLGAS